jgi:hypothetical protein
MIQLDLFEDKFTPVDRKNFGFSSGYFAKNFDWQFLNWLYQGIKESNPSKELLTVLNGNEIAAFCVGTYIIKNKVPISPNNKPISPNTPPINSNDKPMTPELIRSMDNYSLLSHYIGKGMPSLNKRKALQPDFAKQDNGLNPYKENLEKRINSLNTDLKEMREHLCEEPNVYVPECHYEKTKQARHTNHKIEIMYFLPVYPKSGHDYRRNYATELMKIFESIYKK